MSPSPAPWRIRAVQLDLARQRETVEGICRFADFAADHGHNTLLLYLEGVVRTKSFPFRPADASYSPADMERVVKHAARRGLDVVPCIATLGHAEHFLTCKELEPLKESGPNVWGGHMFCPSNAGTYAFLRDYLAEIAAVFPSEQMHIGCDEAWGLGTCPTCRAKLDDGLSHDDLFIEHLLSMHAILQPLGKRPWIWDDMFENAAEKVLRCVPRDFVMCAWTYEADQIDLGGYQGHFNNLRRRDWLSIYARLGFDVLLCPVASGPRSTQALTRYGRRGPVLGGLQTIWELSHSFLPRQLPGVALAGRLWSEPALDVNEAWPATIDALLPDLTPVERAAAGTAALEGQSLTYGPWPAAALRGPLSNVEARAVAAMELAGATLEAAMARLQAEGSKAAETQRDLVEDLLILTRDVVLWGKVREALADRIDPRVAPGDPAAGRRAIDDCLARMADLQKRRADQWARHRPGIAPELASPPHRDAAARLRKFVDEIEATPVSQRAMLDLRLFLWDAFSGPQLRVELRCNGEWRDLFTGGFKPADVRAPVPYRLRLPLRQMGPAEPDAVRLTVTGFGGQGLSFASLVLADHALVPAEVVEVSGQVVNAKAALLDDSSFAYLGSPDTMRTLLDQTQRAAATITLRLAREAESERSC
ncbi:MAG: family 20 glycosylhydrolase [Planctomycetota bacterium]|nr:family 20 glycosylhydrolase [Planctomycetota bacterium]